MVGYQKEHILQKTLLGSQRIRRVHPAQTELEFRLKLLNEGSFFDYNYLLIKTFRMR
jgi:hypothetical protein